jgi:hypothetical protein
MIKRILPTVTVIVSLITGVAYGSSVYTTSEGCSSYLRVDRHLFTAQEREHYRRGEFTMWPLYRPRRVGDFRFFSHFCFDATRRRPWLILGIQVRKYPYGRRTYSGAGRPRGVQRNDKEENKW